MFGIGCICFPFFLDGTLDLDLDIGISLVEIRNWISGEQRQASIKGSPEPLASKGIVMKIFVRLSKNVIKF